MGRGLGVTPQCSAAPLRSGGKEQPPQHSRCRAAVSRPGLFVSPSRQAWPGTRQKGGEGGRWEAGSHTGSFLGGRKGRCEQGPYAAALHLAEEMHQQQRLTPQRPWQRYELSGTVSCIYQKWVDTRQAVEKGFLSI